MKACRDCKHWEHWVGDDGECHNTLLWVGMSIADKAENKDFTYRIMTPADTHCAHWEEKEDG